MLQEPGNLKKRPVYRPFNSYWFCRYAYQSLYFIQRLKLASVYEEHNGMTCF